MAGLKELVPSPAAGFEQPFEMLKACHERIARMLDLLARLRAHVDANGVDVQAAGAARDVMRYFDLAAPQHHLDEERHVLPALRASGDAALAALADRLQQDHRCMETAWAAARAVLACVEDAQQPALSAEDHAALAAFASLYADHLAAEEGTAFPAAVRRLGDEDLQAMGADMRARRGAG
jgi:hemerythrin-like domain-containing protein